MNRPSSVGGFSNTMENIGREIGFTRDTENRIVRVVNAGGVTSVETTYEYDTAGDLRYFTDLSGQEWEYRYDAEHNLNAIIDPRGINVLNLSYDAEGRLIGTSDALGNATTVTHDTANVRELVTDPAGHTRIYEYDIDGNVTAEYFKPLNGAEELVRSMTYDAKGNQLSETDALGHTTVWTFDSKGNRLSETDALGNSRNLTYDLRGNVLTATDKLGKTTEYRYDANNNRVYQKDRTGAVTTMTYDGKGNMTGIAYPDGSNMSMTYDGYGGMTSFTSANGVVTNITRDGRGNHTGDSHPMTTFDGTQSVNWQYGYDASGALSAIRNPDNQLTTVQRNSIGEIASWYDGGGRNWQIAYDARGMVESYKAPGNRITAMTTDARGRETGVILPNGLTFTKEYDARGRVTKELRPGGGYSETIYDTLGRIGSKRDSRGAVVTYEYDVLNRVKKMYRPGGSTVEYTRDAEGRITAVKDPDGNISATEYDGEGRKTKIILPDGTFARNTYDTLGRVSSRITTTGGRWDYTYDPTGTVAGVLDPLDQLVSYHHDSHGNYDRVTDQNGHNTEFVFDHTGRMLRKTLPAGEEETFAYNTDGLMIGHTDFNGQTTTYTRDATTGRATLVRFHDNTTMAFGYNAQDRLETVTDAGGQAAFTYDLAGRLAGMSLPTGDQMSYAYDTEGGITQRTANGAATQYTFNLRRELTGVTDAYGPAATYIRTLRGLPATLTHNDGTAVSRQFDSVGRTTGITATLSGGTTAFASIYTRDTVGRITEIAEDNGRSAGYAYDALDRLAGEQIAEAGGSTETITYGYDGTGNLTDLTNSHGARQFVYDENDRLLTDGNCDYAWDANGYLTDKVCGTVADQYTWDAQGRLAEVTRIGATPAHIEYAYDFDGLLSRRIVDGIEETYLWDREQRAWPVIVEKRNAAGQLIERFVHGDTLIAGYNAQTGMERRYITDHLGTVRAMIENGTVTRYDYDAFGNIRSAVKPEIGYIGGLHDPDTGFVFLRTRWYAPAMYRFISRDDDNGSEYDTRTINRYVYSFDDPVNRADPSGQVTVSEFLYTMLVCELISQIAMPLTKSALEYVVGAFTGLESIGLSFKNRTGDLYQYFSLTVQSTKRFLDYGVGLDFEFVEWDKSKSTDAFIVPQVLFTYGGGGYNTAININYGGISALLEPVSKGIVYDTNTPNEYKGPALMINLSFGKMFDYFRGKGISVQQPSAGSTVAVFGSLMPAIEGRRPHGYQVQTNITLGYSAAKSGLNVSFSIAVVMACHVTDYY